MANEFLQPKKKNHSIHIFFKMTPLVLLVFTINCVVFTFKIITYNDRTIRICRYPYYIY